MIGRTIGPYEILGKLGEGGMGEVYRARDTRLDRTVAIKIIRTDFSERFEREAKSISALNHPHICTLHDVGRTGEFAYLVMELVDGAPVSGPLPADEVLKLGLQICEALHAAHQKGIVHRDLKPANILVSRGSIKLLDFGLAKPHRSTTQAADQATVAALTGAHTIVGTPQYMAPEQIEGRDVDIRTDIFALGCVLYELTTGRRAFEGRTASSIMAAILATEPRKPSELVPVTPPALEWVILRCLDKDPDARWQSAHDVGLQLKWIAQHRAELPQAAGIGRNVMRRYLVAAVASGLILGAAAAYWLGAARRSATPSGSAAQVAMTVTTPPKVALSRGDVRSAVALSPDGRTLVFAGTPENGEPALYLRHLDQLEAVKIAGTENGTGPFFSYDGKWIGFFENLKIRKVPIGGGVPVEICDAPLLRGVTWLEDGTIVFTPGPTGGLMRVKDSGGTPSVLTTLDAVRNEKTHRTPIALPGGKAIVFTIGNNEIGTYDDARIVAMNLETRVISELATGYAPTFSSTGHLLYVRNATVFAVPFDPVGLKTGGSPVQVLGNVSTQPHFGAADFDVSPNGVTVYVTGGNRTEDDELRWVDRDGGAMQAIPIEPREYYGASVSPDGRRLLLEVGGANNSVWTYDIARSQPTRLTFKLDIERAVWSHDGASVTYWSGTDLRSVSADGIGREEVLIPASETGGLALWPAGWSSDGQTLALSVYAPGKSNDVAIYSRKDRKVRLIVESRFSEAASDLSPDGRWLLYSSDETGDPEIYVRDLAGSGQKHPVTSGGSRIARWSRGGREVVYESGQGAMAVSFTPGSPPVVGKPERLFAKAKDEEFINAIDLFPAPDGNRFLIVFNKPLPRLTEIRVVTNWTQQLAQHWR